jgi:hypothetical protein
MDVFVVKCIVVNKVHNQGGVLTRIGVIGIIAHLLVCIVVGRLGSLLAQAVTSSAT